MKHGVEGSRRRSGTTVLYVSRNDGTDTRISKECNSLQAAGYRVVFLGWDRNPDAKKSNPMPTIPKEIMVGQTGTGLPRTLCQFVNFYVFLVRRLFRLRPQIVHAVNEEVSFLVMPFKWPLGFRLVADIFDSIALKFGSSRFPLRHAAGIVSAMVWRAADALLVTDAERAALLPAHSQKVFIVPNYPVDIGAPSPRQSARRGLSGTITLYVAGTLYRQRGLRQLLNVLDTDPALCIVAAGWLYDSAARDFIANAQVDFRGLVTPSQSLHLTASCDAVYCYYEPNNLNNIMASPNKVYDAMCVGRPVLINSEVKMAAWVRKHRLGFTAPYADTQALAGLIDRLRYGLGDQQAEAGRLRTIFLTGYSWTQAEAALFNCYKRLTGASA